MNNIKLNEESKIFFVKNNIEKFYNIFIELANNFSILFNVKKINK
jgi:hypothetical protein